MSLPRLTVAAVLAAAALLALPNEGACGGAGEPARLESVAADILRRDMG